jgi:hypothetical protein
MEVIFPYADWRYRTLVRGDAQKEHTMSKNNAQKVFYKVILYVSVFISVNQDEWYN